MVSAQIPAMIRIYAQDPAGNKIKIAQFRTSDSAPAGGASEGALANVATPEKRITINSNVRLLRDWVLLFTAEADSAKTIGTVAKSIWSIPTVTPSGSNTLGTANMTVPTFTAIALAANRETVIAGYNVIEGWLQVQGRIFQDLQDNA
jgi:hypothetical protein